MRAVLWISFAFFPCLLLGNGDLPQDPASFFESHCFECHAGDEEFIEGDVNLEKATFDWSAAETSDFWTRVYEVVHTSDMPPRDADSFPSAREREDLLSWLGANLTQHAPFGGTLPRRLNKVEYENTIRTLFDDPEFSVPPLFPLMNPRKDSTTLPQA